MCNGLDLFVRSSGPQFPTINEPPGAEIIPTITGGTLGSTCPGSPVVFSGGGGSGTLSAIATGSLTFTTLPDESEMLSNQYLYDSLRLDSVLVASDTLFSNCLDTLNTTPLQNIYDVNQALLSRDVSMAGMYNSGISATDLICQNHKLCNSILAVCLDTLGHSPMDSTVIANLKYLAEQCPLEGGKAVYEARVLLSTIDPLKTYEGDCDHLNTGLPQKPVQEETVEEVSKPKGFFYPNPAGDQVTFGTDQQGCLVEIYYLDGRKVASFRLEDRTETRSIPVNSWVKGVYLIRMRFEDGTIQQEKLLVQ